VGVIDRRRHERRGFLARIAEHDALVAGTFVAIASGIDALGDVGGLRMQVHFDIGLLPMKARLLVTDVFDGKPREVRNVILGDGRGPAGLARDHDTVGGRKRLAGNAYVPRIPTVARPEIEERVDHFIGNPVTDFVRMTFGNRLAREQIACTGHVLLQPRPTGHPSIEGVSCSAAERGQAVWRGCKPFQWATALSSCRLAAATGEAQQQPSGNECIGDVVSYPRIGRRRDRLR